MAKDDERQQKSAKDGKNTSENRRKMAKVVVLNKNAHKCTVQCAHIAICLHRIKLMFFNNAGMLTSETYK